MARTGRIAKNTAYLTVASILQKAISFGYYAYLATAIGSEQLGLYDSALKFTSVFIIFMDFGLGPLLTREAAKDEEKLIDHYRNILSIKLILILISLTAMIVSVHFWNLLYETVSQDDVNLVYFGASIIVLDTITFTFFSVFRALRNLYWEAIGIVIYQGMILAVGIAAIYLGLPLIYILGALFVGSFVQFVYMYFLIRYKAKIRFQFQWHTPTVKKILSLAAPFAFAGIIFRLNGTVDSLMLKTMAGNRFNGWYALAFKLVFALTVLPGAFATSYFPAISTYYKEAKEKLHSTFESGVFYMLLLGLPITAGTLILGDDIIISVWGEDWEASIQPLWILMIALPFIFLNYPVGNFLNAVDKQKLNTVNMLIALVINIVLNFVLIPYHTFNGAAIALAVSSIVLVILGIPWVYTIAPFSFNYIFKKSFIILIASGMMGFVLFFIQNNYPIIVLISIGAVVYFASLLLLKGLTQSELLQLKKAIIKRG